jgi:hypothetical protein
MTKYTDKDQLRRILSLALMLFSGIGFKIFQFSASLIVWMIILFILNFKNIIKIPVRAWLGTGILIVLFIFVFILKGAVLPYFVIVTIISALFVLSNYFNNEGLFFSDFSKLLQFYMYYALFAIPIMLFGTSMFNQVMLDYSEYRTFYWLFWFSPIGGPSFFNGFRPDGFCWEPGIWQLFLNLNFLFALYENRSIKKIFLAILAAISVFSTTGIILICFVYVLYFLFVNKKIIIAKILIPLILFIVSFPLLVLNINEKISGQYSGSGMTRIADFFTGVNLLRVHPIFGADTELATAANNPLIWAIKVNFWSGDYSDGGFDGFMNVSNCNGIIILLLDWGLPIGLYILFRTIKSNLFVDKRFGIVFMVIIYISMFTEPISRTSFFYFFILSSFLLTSNRNKCYEL